MNSRFFRSRRQALGFLLGLSTLSFLYPKELKGQRLPSSSDRVLNIARQLVLVFKDRSSAGVVGRAYLDENKEEDSVAFLASTLVLETGLADLPQLPSGVGDYRERIWNATRRDFDTNEVVQINGWILSRTEARLCALATYI